MGKILKCARLRDGQLRNRGSIPEGGKKLFSITSGLDLGSTQSLIYFHCTLIRRNRPKNNTLSSSHNKVSLTFPTNFHFHPVFYCISLSLSYNGYWLLFSLGVKRQRRETDHSPPSSVEVKSYTCKPCA
jgi:hypothetical protein